jgi:hypothetical protein
MSDPNDRDEEPERRDREPDEQRENDAASEDGPASEDARLRALVARAMRASRDESAADTDANRDDDTDEALDDDADADRDDDADEALDDVDLKEALRGALAPPRGSVAPKLLRGVQRRIRVRSQGKFFGDGWSTEESPRTTYLVTSALMLVLIALVFLVLVPQAATKLP